MYLSWEERTLVSYNITNNSLKHIHHQLSIINGDSLLTVATNEDVAINLVIAFGDVTNVITS